MKPHPNRKRLPRALFALAVIALAVAPTAAGAVVRQSLSDAYLQVSVFVAATLALFYVLERRFDIDTAGFVSRHKRWQVPIASFFGALPGCGGAVVIVTQFVHGRISFGSFVAVLVATMGDAAFLLLAQRPMLGLAIFALGWVVGTISGYVVDAIHGPNFMHRDRTTIAVAAPANPNSPLTAVGAAVAIDDAPIPAFHRAWLSLGIVGMLLGIFIAFQFDPGERWNLPGYSLFALVLGVVGALFSVLVWVHRGGDSLQSQTFSDSHGCHRLAPLSRVVTDTAFVTTWVIVAYLAFELTLHWTQFDLKTFFAASAPFVPLIGAVIGLLPGCGPQVITTTLYLNGFIPLSAQISNALSNDGDALFPALALTPRAAILATVYTTIPALIVGYGYYFFFE